MLARLDLEEGRQVGDGLPDRADDGHRDRVGAVVGQVHRHLQVGDARLEALRPFSDDMVAGPRIPASDAGRRPEGGGRGGHRGRDLVLMVVTQVQEYRSRPAPPGRPATARRCLPGHSGRSRRSTPRGGYSPRATRTPAGPGAGSGITCLSAGGFAAAAARSLTERGGEDNPGVWGHAQSRWTWVKVLAR